MRSEAKRQHEGRCIIQMTTAHTSFSFYLCVSYEKKNIQTLPTQGMMDLQVFVSILIKVHSWCTLLYVPLSLWSLAYNRSFGSSGEDKWLVSHHSAYTIELGSSTAHDSPSPFLFSLTDAQTHNVHMQTESLIIAALCVWRCERVGGGRGGSRSRVIAADTFSNSSYIARFSCVFCIFFPCIFYEYLLWKCTRHGGKLLRAVRLWFRENKTWLCASTIKCVKWMQSHLSKSHPNRLHFPPSRDEYSNHENCIIPILLCNESLKVSEIQLSEERKRKWKRMRERNNGNWNALILA